jgi:hypothetical protein
MTCFYFVSLFFIYQIIIIIISASLPFIKGDDASDVFLSFSQNFLNSRSFNHAAPSLSVPSQFTIQVPIDPIFDVFLSQNKEGFDAVSQEQKRHRFSISPQHSKMIRETFLIGDDDVKNDDSFPSNSFLRLCVHPVSSKNPSTISVSIPDHVQNCRMVSLLDFFELEQNHDEDETECGITMTWKVKRGGMILLFQFLDFEIKTAAAQEVSLIFVVSFLKGNQIRKNEANVHRLSPLKLAELHEEAKKIKSEEVIAKEASENIAVISSSIDGNNIKTQLFKEQADLLEQFYANCILNSNSAQERFQVNKNDEKQQQHSEEEEIVPSQEQTDKEEKNKKVPKFLTIFPRISFDDDDPVDRIHFLLASKNFPVFHHRFNRNNNNNNIHEQQQQPILKFNSKNTKSGDTSVDILAQETAIIPFSKLEMEEQKESQFLSISRCEYFEISAEGNVYADPQLRKESIAREEFCLKNCLQWCIFSNEQNVPRDFPLVDRSEEKQQEGKNKKQALLCSSQPGENATQLYSSSLFSSLPENNQTENNNKNIFSPVLAVWISTCSDVLASPIMMGTNRHLQVEDSERSNIQHYYKLKIRWAQSLNDTVDDVEGEDTSEISGWWEVLGFILEIVFEILGAF